MQLNPLYMKFLVWRCVRDHLRGQRLPLDAIYTDATALRLP